MAHIKINESFVPTHGVPNWSHLSKTTVEAHPQKHCDADKKKKKRSSIKRFKRKTREKKHGDKLEEKRGETHGEKPGGESGKTREKPGKKPGETRGEKLAVLDAKTANLIEKANQRFRKYGPPGTSSPDFSVTSRSFARTYFNFGVEEKYLECVRFDYRPNHDPIQLKGEPLEQSQILSKSGYNAGKFGDYAEVFVINNFPCPCGRKLVKFNPVNTPWCDANCTNPHCENVEIKSTNSHSLILRGGSWSCLTELTQAPIIGWFNAKKGTLTYVRSYNVKFTNGCGNKSTISLSNVSVPGKGWETTDARMEREIKAARGRDRQHRRRLQTWEWV
jgi:hypothetical protein